jgi:hypothetical protein
MSCGPNGAVIVSRHRKACARFLEEAYGVGRLDAADDDNLREELGDRLPHSDAVTLAAEGLGRSR